MDADRDAEEEDDDEQPVIIEVEDALLAAQECAVSADILQIVGKHRRCAAHTVNLLATRDVEKVPGWTTNPRRPFTKTAAKAQAIWNAQNRKTVTANDIKAALGRKLVTPGATRWNSSHDAYKCLVKEVQDPEKRNKLNQICLRQHPAPLATINEEDVEIMGEYVKVTGPLAKCLDTLQGEEKAYMGSMLPHLQFLKDSLRKLQADNTLIHSKELVNYLLEHPVQTNGFKGR